VTRLGSTATWMAGGPKGEPPSERAGRLAAGAEDVSGRTVRYALTGGLLPGIEDGTVLDLLRKLWRAGEICLRKTYGLLLEEGGCLLLLDLSGGLYAELELLALGGAGACVALRTEKSRPLRCAVRRRNTGSRAHGTEPTQVLAVVEEIGDRTECRLSEEPGPLLEYFELARTERRLVSATFLDSSDDELVEVFEALGDRRAVKGFRSNPMRTQEAIYCSTDLEEALELLSSIRGPLREEPLEGSPRDRGRASALGVDGLRGSSWWGPTFRPDPPRGPREMPGPPGRGPRERPRGPESSGRGPRGRPRREPSARGPRGPPPWGEGTQDPGSEDLGGPRGPIGPREDPRCPSADEVGLCHRFIGWARKTFRNEGDEIRVELNEALAWLRTAESSGGDPEWQSIDALIRLGPRYLRWEISVGLKGWTSYKIRVAVKGRSRR